MRINVRVVPGNRLAGAPERLIKALEGAMTLHAYDVLAEANLSIQRGPKTGRVYKRGKVQHRASAPGEPPATDTGRLVSSGHVEPARVTGYTVAATVSWPVDYAAWLEKGWVMKGGTHVAARPYARPAVVKLQPAGRDRVRKALEEASK
jgi:hypothetical protein